jgi:hydrogenase maturation protease
MNIDVLSSLTHPTRALVIGYGSPIRGDDAVGPLAVEQLRKYPLPHWLNICVRHALTTELIVDLMNVDRVIFVDAALDLPAGQIRCQPLTVPTAVTANALAHTNTPQELLAWSYALYQQAPQAWLISIGGASFEYAYCTLSEPVHNALDSLLEHIVTILVQSSLS